jgi:putative salt-induced outer membrane protein YdiY
MENFKKTLFLLLFFTNMLSLYAKDDIQLYKIEDNSGLSTQELRQKIDKRELQEAKAKESRWEELSPSPKECDWVETKSNEWFCGTIEGMYNDKLEFDSKEIGGYTFDFEDVKQIKSKNPMSVNVENSAQIEGIVRLKGDIFRVIQGDKEYTLARQNIISFAPYTQQEADYWSGKIILSLDARYGNIRQKDYTGELYLKRRRADSLVDISYLGRISRQDAIEIANDHRVSFKYDRYLSRYLFWTPLSAEYYTDRYKNIAHQITAGLGVGYRVFDTKKIFWSFSGGPASVYTRYVTVDKFQKKSNYSPAFELSTKYTYEFNKITNLAFDYKVIFSDEKAGRYKHHMVTKLENKLLSWLDIDITTIWDYIENPQVNNSGKISKKSDFEILVGFGIEF